jgi:hypothetical protein
VEELLAVCAVDVDEIAWLVDSVCEWLVEVPVGVGLRARYPPTAATMTTTTIMVTTLVLIAFRPL